MKLLVGVVALALATLPAFAQDAASAGVSASQAASPLASSSSAPAATPGASSAPAAANVPGFTFTQVMGSLADPSTETAAISAIDKKANVTFVEVHLLAGYDAAALTFTQAQSDALNALHKTIGRNNALMKKLRKAGYLLDDVIAVLVDASGAPVVFIDL